MTKQIYRFQVLLFAALKDVVGKDRIEITVATEATITVRDLLTACAAQYPALERWLPHVKVAVDCAYADSDQAVPPGAELALLPPVAGGDL